MNLQHWTALTAIMGAIAIAAGAFGAHGLKSVLDQYSMGVYEKALWYQTIHVLALLLIIVLGKTGLISELWTSRIAILWLLGIVIFSGSLYALALSGVKILGAITPIGGALFIVGWLTLAWAALRG